MGRWTAGVWIWLGAALVGLVFFPRDGRCDRASTESGAPPPTNIVCDQSYALCTSAPCIPDPDDPEKQALCSCAVHDGYSLGQTSCASRAKKTIGLLYAAHRSASADRRQPPIQSTLELLTSTFSFAELVGPGAKSILICPEGNPWTDCLDAPCSVDPRDPAKALCRCPIVREGRFLTLGGTVDGQCLDDTCARAYWSAATPLMMESASSALNSVLGTDVTWQDHVCGQRPDGSR